MQFVIGVVPSASVSERIVAFQRKATGNTYPQLVEPHITVKAQGGLTEDLQWLEGVEKTAAETSPFSVTLGKPDTFGSSVAFMSVSSPALQLLHKTFVELVSPSKELLERYFEQPGAFVFHLTLGTTSCGLDENQVLEMAAAASTDLADLPLFEVGFVRVYRQQASDSPYLPFRDLPFGRRPL